MLFTEAAIIDLYAKSLAQAEEGLASLPVAEGRKPNAHGLSGWVFEQTIRCCLVRELAAVGLQPDVQEQVALIGRARVDLRVGNAAIEIKARGSFGAGDSKYADYRRVVEQRGWTYLYLTMQESHAPYRDATLATFGADRAFFLDTPGEWARFVEEAVEVQTTTG